MSMLEQELRESIDDRGVKSAEFMANAVANAVLKDDKLVPDAMERVNLARLIAVRIMRQADDMASELERGDGLAENLNLAFAALNADDEAKNG